jgi:outer membrane protein assembly factor BamB
VGNPPIEKLQGRTFEVGLAAIHSVANTDNALYWLADDRRIYRTTAGAKEVISTMPISNEINKYAKQAITNIDDAIGSTFTIGSDSFYVLTFPRNDKTFLYNENLGELGWSELSSGSAGGRYQGNSFLSAYGKTYVADVTNGNIYTLDLDTYTNNGDSIRRERVTGSVHGGLVGAPGARLQMSKAKFIMETGVGLINGQGDNPRIMIEYSDDGGRTFQHGSWPRVGRLGEFTLQVEFFNLGTFYDRIFRISTSDNVNYSIFSGTIDLRLAGI